MTAAPDRPAWLRWVTRIVLLAGAIGLIATVYLVGPATILAQLRAIGPWFAVLIAADVAMTSLDAAAIHGLTRGTGAPPYARVVIAQLAGRAVNAVTPGGNLGEALKASILSEQTKTARVVAAVMYCGLCSLCISLAMVAVGAPATAVLMDLEPPARIALCVGGLASAAVMIALIMLVRRGMLASVVAVAARLRLVSRKRRKAWAARLADIDVRLGRDGDHRGRTQAILLVLLSKTLGWGTTWLTVAVVGYTLELPELTALLSAGVVLGWMSTVVPMGLGVSEGGNYALFAMIGAPASLGVSLSLSRRVMQVLLAVVGFSVLALYRLSQRIAARAARLRQRRAKAARSRAIQPT